MPTIFRADGFRFVIYANDHRPIHVHAINAGGAAVIEVEHDVTNLRSVHDLSVAQVRKAMKLAYENRALIRKKWEEIHGDG